MKKFISMSLIHLDYNVFKRLRNDILYVYFIPSAFKRTAKELIKKYDERNAANDLVDKLGLRDLLDRNVGNLSGGELQRLAVAIASAKDADYYFFDEPSSFNDVYQRLVVARV